MDVLVVDLGLVLLMLGALGVVRPMVRLFLPTRRRAVVAAAIGAVVLVTGLLLPVMPPRLVGPPMLLDQVVPAYEFGEHHEIRIAAPPARVFAAVRAVTAREIRFFRLLTFIRSPRLPGAGRASILNAPPDRPLLDVALGSGFVSLGEAADRELVFGTVVCCGPRRDPPIASDFVAPSGSRALAVMNFHLSDAGNGITKLVTETRIHATDPSSRSRFAVYWRLIYPGSAFIRRMWLDAIRRRAERPPA